MKFFTKHAGLRKTIAGIAAASSITLAALQPANAQCLSGLGTTSSQLATQTWPAAFTGTDYTSVHTQNSSADYTKAFSKATSVAVDSNYVYVLDLSGGTNGFNNTVPGVFRLTASGSQLNSQGVYPVNHSLYPNRVFSAGGTIWVAEPGGYVEVLAVGSQQVGSGQGGQLNLGYAVQGANVIGATFDGSHIWFSTSNGFLIEVKPPAVTSSIPNLTPPTVVRSLQISKESLGSLVFDGQYIWTYSGVSLIQFNPQSGKVLSSTPINSMIDSLVFDGTYFWLGTQNGAVKFDPVKSTTIFNVPTIHAGTLFFDGSSVTVFDQKGEMVKARSCDGAILGNSILPAPPVQEAFDGSLHWIVYGNNTVSAR